MLRPRGEAIIRTRTATSHIGNDLHRVFDIPYPHVLFFGRPALESVTTEASIVLPNLNFLTASSYLAIFNYAGFEIMDVRRRRSSAGSRGEVEDRIRELFPGVSDDELFCADLDVRLVKPIDPKDLPGPAPGQPHADAARHLRTPALARRGSRRSLPRHRPDPGSGAAARAGGRLPARP